jgi:hypothetical protein
LLKDIAQFLERGYRLHNSFSTARTGGPCAGSSNCRFAKRRNIQTTATAKAKQARFRAGIQPTAARRRTTTTTTNGMELERVIVKIVYTNQP